MCVCLFFFFSLGAIACRKSIGYNTEQEIDNRIASIEFQLCTESVPLKEEKKLLAEIQILKKNRPKVSTVQQMEQPLVFGPDVDELGCELRHFSAN